MSCPNTQHLLTEYFSDDATNLMRGEIDRHLAGCDACRSELNLLLATRHQLEAWQEQRVPHWNRGLAQFRRDHATVNSARRGAWFWQWLPTAASFAMLALLVFNVSIISSDRGFAISFGASGEALSETVLEQRLADFETNQQLRQTQDLQAFMARIDERHDANNINLMQAVMEQTSQLNGENFERIYAYFEQQRQQDLQSVLTGYQQLADSGYQTIQNVQQLANFVRFQGDVR
jgi:hypothetical protein